MMKISEPLDRFHKRSNVICNSIGFFQDSYTREDVADIDIIEMDGDKNYDVVVCSDGVSDCLSNDEMIEIINSSDSKDVAKNLVYGALNSNPNFIKEYSKQEAKVRKGLISIKEWNLLNEALRRSGLNYKTAKEIKGGDDNTTAASIHVSRRR